MTRKTPTPAQIVTTGKAIRILASRIEKSDLKEQVCALMAEDLGKSWYNRMTAAMCRWMDKNADPREPLMRLARGTHMRTLRGMVNRIGNMGHVAIRPIEYVDYDDRGKGSIDHFFSYMDNRQAMGQRRHFASTLASEVKTLEKYASLMEQVEPGVIAAIMPAGLKTKAGKALLEQVGATTLITAAETEVKKTKTTKRKAKAAKQPVAQPMGA